jgi:hypothetical protein
MPLLDHFHAPVKDLLRWEALHAAWATYLATALNERWLSKRFLASEHVHRGPRVEIDVGVEDRPTVPSPLNSGNGPVATRAQTWTVPAATCTIPALFPDSFEVLIHADEGGWKLVGAIELISPSNKDRAAERRAFAAKCVSYLHEGVSVVLIDVITSRRANLHNEVLNLLEQSDPARLPGEAELYAAAYCPLTVNNQPQMKVWTAACALGEPLPTMPLRLMHEVFVPVEFEDTYMETCRRRRVV